MTDAVAAQVYLADICISNRTVNAFNAALDAGDYPTLQAAASAARDADSEVAGRFDKALWPDDVKADIATMRDALFAEASYDSAVASAGSMNAVSGLQFPDLTASSTASQRIRSRLNLPSDPMAGC
jgi:hypothetical protein